MIRVSSPHSRHESQFAVQFFSLRFSNNLEWWSFWLGPFALWQQTLGQFLIPLITSFDVNRKCRLTGGKDLEVSEPKHAIAQSSALPKIHICFLFVCIMLLIYLFNKFFSWSSANWTIDEKNISNTFSLMNIEYQKKRKEKEKGNCRDDFVLVGLKSSRNW